MSFKTKLVLPSYSTHEWSASPECVVVEDGQELLARVKLLSQLVTEHGLSEVSTYYDAEWLPESVADDLRLQGLTLVVGSISFWFLDHPKHSETVITSESMMISTLEGVIESAVELYFHEDPSQSNLANLYTEIMSATETEE